MPCGCGTLDPEELDARYLAVLARWPSEPAPEWAVEWSMDMLMDAEEELGEANCQVLRMLEVSANAIQGGLERM